MIALYYRLLANQTLCRPSVKQSRELTTMSTGGIFGLGEMLLSMETYGLSLRANETTAVLRMRSDHLMSVVKKFHPEVNVVNEGG